MSEGNRYGVPSDAAPKSGGPKIIIERIELDLDPSIEIFSVAIEDNHTTWKETVPTEENLHWFLRGVRAGASEYGKTHVTPPEIPRNAKRVRIRE